jgi:outer membrane immunogenic protein
MRSLGFALMLTLGFAGPALGQSDHFRDDPAWFVRTRALAGLSHAPGRFLELPAAATGSSQVSEDYQAYFGAGAGIGYRSNFAGVPIRAILDGSVNFRHDTDMAATVPTGTSTVYENNLRAWDIRFSLLADIWRLPWGSVYLGAGLGATQLQHRVTVRGAPERIDQDEWRATPSLEAGLLFDRAFQRVVPEFSYRFRWLGDTEAVPLPGGGVLVYEDAFIHDFMLGFTVPLAGGQTPDGPPVLSDLPSGGRAGYHWSGFHLGVFAGGSWAEDIGVSGLTPAYDPLAEQSGALTPSGFTGGGEIGVDWQWGWLVAGLTGEAGVLRLDDTLLVEASGGQATTTLESNAYGAVTGRLGFAHDRLLAYLRGGAAFLDAEAQFVRDCFAPLCTPGAATGHDNAVLFGWTAGLGAEYALGSRWSAGAEYRYFDFYDDLSPVGRTDRGGLISQAIGAEGIDGIHTVRGRLSYRW